MLDQTCTLYHREVKDGAVTYGRTVLRGVHWDEEKGANVIESGLTSADRVTLVIPFSVHPGLVISEGLDYITHGVGPEATTEEEMKALKKSNPLTYKVTTVDTKAYGSYHLQHWSVRGV